MLTARRQAILGVIAGAALGVLVAPALLGASRTEPATEQPAPKSCCGGARGPRQGARPGRGDDDGPHASARDGRGGETAEHPGDLRRRHRPDEHQRLHDGPDGLPHAEHRPHRQGRDDLHRLLRRAELHGRPIDLHHRPVHLPHRPEQSRHAGRRPGPAARRTRPSPNCSSRTATPPASSARTTWATGTSSCRPSTASTSSSATSTTSTPRRSRRTATTPATPSSARSSVPRGVAASDCKANRATARRPSKTPGR